MSPRVDIRDDESLEFVFLANRSPQTQVGTVVSFWGQRNFISIFIFIFILGGRDTYIFMIAVFLHIRRRGQLVRELSVRDRWDVPISLSDEREYDIVFSVILHPRFHYLKLILNLNLGVDSKMLLLNPFCGLGRFG